MQEQEAFGPFYRIEQLLLTTQASGRGRYTTPGGLPAILTDANIQLLFDMQDEVDALTAHTKVSAGRVSFPEAHAVVPACPGDILLICKALLKPPSGLLRSRHISRTRTSCTPLHTFQPDFPHKDICCVRRRGAM